MWITLWTSLFITVFKSHSLWTFLTHFFLESVSLHRNVYIHTHNQCDYINFKLGKYSISVGLWTAQIQCSALQNHKVWRCMVRVLYNYTQAHIWLLCVIYVLWRIVREGALHILPAQLHTQKDSFAHLTSISEINACREIFNGTQRRLGSESLVVSPCQA